MILENQHFFFKNIFILYLLVLIGTAVIPLGSAATMNEMFLFELRFDYLMHILVFAPLVPLWSLAFSRHPMRWIVAVGFVLATGCECVDYWLYYRGFNMFDLLANLVGIVLSVFLLQIGLLLRKKLVH